jgi:hypothetical protein
MAPRSTNARLGFSPAGDDVPGGLSAAEPWEVAEPSFLSFSSIETALVSTKGREP